MESKLILGTVQFGIDYGVNNSIGKLEENQVLELFKIASNILTYIKPLLPLILGLALPFTFTTSHK